MTGKEGYFLAKKEAKDAIMVKLELLEEKKLRAFKDGNSELVLLTQTRIDALGEIASFIRNSMLWNSSND